MSMRPLSEFPTKTLKSIKYLLADIDDTITTEGRLTVAAYGALARLQESGLRVVPITGRPAGWCDHFARMWPIDAIVGENGAFYFRYDHNARKFHKRFSASHEQRQSNRVRLNDIAQLIIKEVPGTALASDHMYREADIAIDFCEDVVRLAENEVNRIVGLMEERGLTAKVSSIHVNGWFGDYDKLTMTKLLMADVFHCDIENHKDEFVFIGDSPNDQPMFGYFPNAVGVANLKNFESTLATKPAYVTTLEAGCGFVELADILISARAP